MAGSAEIVQYSSDATGHAIKSQVSGFNATVYDRVLEIWSEGSIIYKIDKLSKSNKETFIGISKLLDNFPNQSRFTVSVVEYVYGSSLADSNKIFYNQSLTVTIPQNSATLPTFSHSISSSDLVLVSSSDLVLERYVKGTSKITCNVSNISTKYGASVVDVALWIGSNKYSGGNVTQITQTIADDGLGTEVYVELTDSRGFKTTSSKQTIDVYSYSPPQIQPADSGDVQVKRGKKDGENIIFADNYEGLFIKAKAGCSPLGGVNKVTLSYKKKVGPKGEYQDANILLSSVDNGTTYIDVVENESLDITAVYYVELTVTDAVGNATSRVFAIPSEKVFMEKNGVKGTISFGGHAVSNNATEVHNRGIFYDDVLISNGKGIIFNEGNNMYKLSVDVGKLKLELVEEDTTQTFSLRRRKEE